MLFTLKITFIPCGNEKKTIFAQPFARVGASNGQRKRKTHNTILNYKMKKRFITLALATLLLMPAAVAQSRAEPAKQRDSVEVTAGNASVKATSDGSVYITNGTDSVKVSSGAIAGQIQHALGQVRQWSDDTIATQDMSASSQPDADATQMAELDLRRERGWQKMVAMIVMTVTGGCVLIALLALLFAHLHRRTKYRTIAKAIENGYPLPPEMMGGRTPQPVYHTTVQQPQPQWMGTPSQQPQQQFADGGQPEPQQQFADGGQRPPFRFTSIKQWPWIVGCLCGSIFFLIAGAEEVAGFIFVVLVWIVARALPTYLDWRNGYNVDPFGSNAWRNTPRQPKTEQQPQQQDQPNQQQ